MEIEVVLRLVVMGFWVCLMAVNLFYAWKYLK
jgi:hypothetical protein